MLSLPGSNSPPLGGNEVGRWVKYTLTYSDFSDTGASKQVALHTLAAGGIVRGSKIKHSTPFSGGTAASATVSVGIAADSDILGSPFDVFQAAGGTTFQLSEVLQSWDHGSTTALIAECVITGDTLDNLSAGVVDIWLYILEAV